MIRLLWLLPCIILYLLLAQYLLSPVYKFPQPQPFSGQVIYNPYQEADSAHWLRCNFHVHSNAWFGLTDGSKNNSKDIYNRYHQLGYDVINISDYQKINTFGKDNECYIPVYEHGYGLQKIHQLCLGSDKVSWVDFPIFQNINQKQYLIKTLKKHNQLVFVAHPKFSRGFSPKDFRYLTGYDGIEVLNHYRNSTEHWDVALSTGHYAPLLADDDAHDVTLPPKIARRYTFVNAPSAKQQDVLDAIKAGRTYGIDDGKPQNISWEQKIAWMKIVPRLLKATVRNDTFVVAVSDTAAKFRFIGQNGKVKLEVNKQNKASCLIIPSDTYIRTEISFKDGRTMYLNPIVRNNENKPPQMQATTINFFSTWILRMGIAVLLIYVVYYIIRKRR
ncbi:MAG: hypothetical protein M0R21_05555 [Lentimicrobiaceae bacterium]|nr:hypothetical protein [Lentimicrobiaceae bacterium]